MLLEYVKNRRKKKFFEKIDPFIREGLIRPVYEGIDFCIISVGDRFYAACPYWLHKNPMSNEKMAFGFSVADLNVLKKFVKDERYFTLHLDNIIDNYEKYSWAVGTFSEESKDKWKEWIEQSKTEGFSLMDDEFEKEITGKSKTR